MKHRCVAKLNLMLFVKYVFLPAVFRVARVSERCQIELRLLIAVITEEDEKTEMKCVTQNMGGRQEVVAMLHLEGEWLHKFSKQERKFFSIDILLSYTAYCFQFYHKNISK